MLKQNLDPVEVDENVEKESVMIKGISNDTGFSISVVNNWAYLEKSNTVVAFGYLENESEGAWLAGFMSIPLERPEEFKVIKPLDSHDPSLYLYLMGLQLFSASRSNDAVAILSFDQGIPGLVVVGGDGRSIEFESSLDGLSPLPLKTEIPRLDNNLSAAKQFKLLEMSSTAAGIYSGTEDYFVLYRSSSRKNESEWSLVRLDVSNGFRGSFPITLPTKANHLTVVSGEEHWAFLEKGPVEDFAVQRMDSLLLIPSSWIEDPAIWDREIDLSGRECQ
jgi:hypothetical protein